MVLNHLWDDWEPLLFLWNVISFHHGKKIGKKKRDYDMDER